MKLRKLICAAVAAAMAASLSLPPVYGDEDSIIGATIEIPTSSSEGSYTVTVGSDGTSTVSTDTTDSTDTSSDTDTTTDENSAGGVRPTQRLTRQQRLKQPTRTPQK